jgi:ankyrin repeat protein
MIACDLKNEEIVETLSSDKRTNFLLEDSTNKTALLYAINNKSKATGEKYVRILLEKAP